MDKKITGALIALGTASVAVGVGLRYAGRVRKKAPYPTPSWFPGDDEVKTVFQQANEELYRQRCTPPHEQYTEGF